MATQADKSRYMGLALEALRKTGAKLRKNFQYLFIEIMFLYVSVRKINFTQMGNIRHSCTALCSTIELFACLDSSPTLQ